MFFLRILKLSNIRVTGRYADTLRSCAIRFICADLRQYKGGHYVSYHPSGTKEAGSRSISLILDVEKLIFFVSY